MKTYRVGRKRKPKEDKTPMFLSPDENVPPKFFKFNPWPGSKKKKRKKNKAYSSY